MHRVFVPGAGLAQIECDLAQHIAAELAGRLKRERRGLPAISLTVNASVLTAVANDYGYDRVFARQVEALGRPGDVLVGISTSGSSPNVVEALKTAIALAYPRSRPDFADKYAVHVCKAVDGIKVLEGL